MKTIWLARAARKKTLPTRQAHSLSAYRGQSAWLVLSVALLAGPAWAQDANHVRRLFEAGQYRQVIDTNVSPESSPEVAYLAALSQQKVGNNEAAAEMYRRLADLPEGNPWRLIGLSGQRFVAGDNNQAREFAQQATAAAPDLPEAHFQLGLVLARVQDWGGAAMAFDRAAELNPAMAYAHYYGGLSDYRSNHPDRMAIHFEQFLKLAPDAPERPEVTQIMRTVRGR
jgi:tetratricopeptide (TPR) repeat protein